MLSVLPYNSRSESSDRPFKTYQPPPRPNMASFSHSQAPPPTSNGYTPYTHNGVPTSRADMTACMSRPDMSYEYPQQPAFPTSQWDYSINTMLKKPEYTPNGLLPHVTVESKPARFSEGASSLTQLTHSTTSGEESKQEEKDDKDSSVPPKKRLLPHSVPEELRDDMYFDRRKKNNESARRSRENRRNKEEQIALRVLYLEQENLQLRTEISLLKTDIDKLRCMLYNS